MPQLDASIITQGLQRVPLKTPQEIYGEQLRLKALRQQIESYDALEQQRREQTAKIQRAEALATQTGEALKQGYKGGKYDRDWLRQNVPPEMLPDVEKYVDTIETNEIERRKKKADLDLLDAEAFGRSAAEIEARGFNPGLAMLAIEAHADQMTPADKLLAEGLVRQGPPGIQQLVAGWKAKSIKQRELAVSESNANKPTEISPGGSLVRPQTGEVVYAAPPKPPTPPNVGSFEDYVTAKYGPRPTPQQIEAARKTYAQADDRAPVVRFQSKDVLNDEGKPVMANYDAVTGVYTDPITRQPIKNPKPIPSAQERMDSRKFEKAAPVLKSIEELSEKINTQQGALAKISGAIERQKAKINLDDDVAEYTALVSGFTPMVARALGHTGVLTQQDVDSVKELFPKPGDSKSLRDRKMKRVLSIISDLETATGGGPAAPAAEEWTRDSTGKLVKKAKP